MTDSSDDRGEHATAGATPRPSPGFGGAVPTTNLDLLLATAVALGLPPAAAWLFDQTGGALASLALYYGVCCLGLVRWRKGTLDYRRPSPWPWAIFLPSLLLPLASAAINAGALPDSGGAPLGVALTLLVWAPLNAAAEQCSWFYVLDAWRNRWPGVRRRLLATAVGVILLLLLVGLIHALFWAKVLPVTEPTPLTRFAIPLNIVLTGAYGLLYYRSRSMWPVFVVHLLVDAQLVLLAHYSILPDL